MAKTSKITLTKKITFRLDDDEYQKILLCVDAPIKIPGFCREAIKRETKRKLKPSGRSNNGLKQQPIC